jgi:hypothetical protein
MALPSHSCNQTATFCSRAVNNQGTPPEQAHPRHIPLAGAFLALLAQIYLFDVANLQGGPGKPFNKAFGLKRVS